MVGGHRLTIRLPQTALLGHATVLVIDRDVGNRRYIGRVLRAVGYFVISFADPDAAREALATGCYDVILLTLDPQQEDWLAIVRACGAVGDAPMLVAAENGNPELVVRVLDSGVEDCLAMPFDAADLSARIARLLRLGWRRHGMATLGRLGDLQLDLVRPRVRLNGCEIGLFKLEYRTLWVLMQGRGSALPFTDIEKRVWGDAKKSRRSALVRIVQNLRRKLPLGPSGSVQLLTIPCIGYRLHAIDRPGVLSDAEAQRDSSRASQH
jgi:DNA-binding response OmpR family regulator